jgi:hypothetical protein
LEAVDVTATGIDWPFAAQVARWTSSTVTKGKTTREELLLITDLCARDLPADKWLDCIRAYWSIETGLHARLDVSAEEDRSRVRTPNNALVLAMFRRVVVSLGIGWIRTHQTKRQKTLRDFFDHNRAQGMKNTFALIRKPAGCRPS